MKLFTTLAMIIGSLVIFSCGDDDNTSDTTTYASLTEFFEQNGPSQQTFSINNSSGGVITGSEGSVFNFPAQSIVDGSGNPVSGTVSVSLKEYYKYNDFVYDLLPTMSTGNMLVTGGAFDINVSQNGTQLYFKDQPTGIQAILPAKTKAGSYVQSMKQFEGERQSNINQNPVNWNIVTDAAIKFDTSQQNYTIENISQFLVNCDAFYSYQGNRTQFTTKLLGVSDLDEASLWFFPDGLPVIIYIYNQNNGSLLTYQNSIPVGITGTLLAFTTEKGYLESGSMQISVTGNDVYDITMTKTNQADLDAFLLSLE